MMKVFLIFIIFLTGKSFSDEKLSPYKFDERYFGNLEITSDVVSFEFKKFGQGYRCKIGDGEFFISTPGKAFSFNKANKIILRGRGSILTIEENDLSGVDYINKKTIRDVIVDRTYLITERLDYRFRGGALEETKIYLIAKVGLDDEILEDVREFLVKNKLITFHEYKNFIFFHDDGFKSIIAKD